MNMGQQTPPMPPSDSMDDIGGTNNEMNSDINDNMGDDISNGMEDDSNSDSDPKKEIQKLTGELSQKLNDYISQNNDDTELSKYVANMIVKQAVKNLSDEDISSIKKKLENDDEDDNSEDDEITESFNQEIFDNKNNLNTNKLPKNKQTQKNNPFISNR